jgi:ABC-type amino acid transport substrate-binding protein
MLSEKMGTRFEAVADLSWSEVLQQARQGKIDIISAIAKSEERAEYLLFTEPYLKLPMVIVTRDDAPVIEGIQDLQGKTIAVMEDYITHSYLKRDYPNQQLLLLRRSAKHCRRLIRVRRMR